MTSSTSHDVNQRERDQFLAKLFKFHERNCTPIKRIPTLGGRELDLYHLYSKVVALGGSEVVSRNRQWGEVARSFNLPPSVTSASYAVRQHFIKLLEKFEAEELGLPSPSAPPSAPQLPPPLSTRSQLHAPTVHITRTPDQPVTATKAQGRGTGLWRVVRSLQSGLPNEVDFAFNVLTVVSMETSHQDQPCTILKEPQLLELMLAHVAVFSEGDPSLEELYHETWHKDSDLDYVEFWQETIPEWLFATLLSSTFTTGPYHTLLFSSRCPISEDMPEGLRVVQVANIIRNISFEGASVHHLASHHGTMKFLLLAIKCSLPPVRGLALDALANLASSVLLSSNDPLSLSDLLLSSIHHCVLSDDKNCVVRGLEILGELVSCDGNEAPLATTPASVYQRMFSLLLLPDCQLVTGTLEALYNLSSCGGEIATTIVAVYRSVETLTSLLTVRVEDFGEEALARVKLIPPQSNVSVRQIQQALNSLVSGSGATVQLPPGLNNQAATLLMQAFAKNLPGGSKPAAGLTAQQLSFLVPNVQQNLLPQPKSPSSLLLASVLPVGQGVLKSPQAAMLQQFKGTPSTLLPLSFSASPPSRVQSLTGVSPVSSRLHQGGAMKSVASQGSLVHGATKFGRPSDEFARQWLRLSYEEGPGLYVSQLDMYTLYMVCCSQLGQSSLQKEDFYSQIRKVFPSSLTARVTVGGNPMLMVAGLRRRTALPSTDSTLVRQNKSLQHLSKAPIGTNLPSVALISAKAPHVPLKPTTSLCPPSATPLSSASSLSLLASPARPVGLSNSLPSSSAACATTSQQPSPAMPSTRTPPPPEQTPPPPGKAPPLLGRALPPLGVTRIEPTKTSRTPSPSLLPTNGISSRSPSRSLSPPSTLSSATPHESTSQDKRSNRQSGNVAIATAAQRLAMSTTALGDSARIVRVPSSMTSSPSRETSPCLSEASPCQPVSSLPQYLRPSSSSRESSPFSELSLGKTIEDAGRNHRILPGLSPQPQRISATNHGISRESSPAPSEASSDRTSLCGRRPSGVSSHRSPSPMDSHQLHRLQVAKHINGHAVKSELRVRNGQVLPVPMTFAPMAATSAQTLEGEQAPLAKRMKIEERGNISSPRESSPSTIESSQRKEAVSDRVTPSSENSKDWMRKGGGSNPLVEKTLPPLPSNSALAATCSSNGPNLAHVTGPAGSGVQPVCPVPPTTSSQVATPDSSRTRTAVHVKQTGVTGLTSVVPKEERTSACMMEGASTTLKGGLKCQWENCNSMQCSWNDLLYHAIYQHVAHISTFPCACKWEGCSSRVKRMSPSLVRHLQTHHCSHGPPPPPPSIPTTLAKLKDMPPLQQEEESPLTKAIRLTAALILRNLAKHVPEARRRLRAQESLLCEVALSGGEASTAIAQCLFHLWHSH